MLQYRTMLNELLRTTQVARKNQIANEARALIDMAYEDVTHATPSDAEAERLLSDLYPWLWGPKSIMNPLIKACDAYDRGGAPTGMEVYNILTIAHRLDRSGVIRRAYEVYTTEARKLPEPDVRMCVG